MELLQSSEVLIRLSWFVALFATLALLEHVFPRRQRQLSRSARWPSNIAIAALNQITARLLLPISMVALALIAQNNGWGLLNLLTLPSWLAVVLAVLLLDLVIYLQHRLYHIVPLLWRFHRMHHADVEFDITTGIRFHPLSVLLSAAIKLGAVILIGPTPMAVLIFEVLLNGTSLFNHSNLRLPPRLDATLRWLLVTPDMHRVHHSSDPDETNRNFGFNFPWWDRIFGSYHAQPALGHERMTVGLVVFRTAAERRLDRLLSQPFRNADHQIL